MGLKSEQLHPDLSEYRITLLNEYSYSFVIERSFDDQSNVIVKLGVDHSGWLTDSDENRVLVTKQRIPVWQLDNREDANALIRLLTTIRDDAFPEQQPTE